MSVSFSAYMNGNHYHERLQINQDYSASQLFFDYGTRFGIGYQINDKIGIQATINKHFGFGLWLPHLAHAISVQP